MFETELHNCVPEYFRSIFEQEEHENKLAYERQLHYEANCKKLDEAEKSGHLILEYNGHNACLYCENADYDTQRHELDDSCLVICKNPDCPEHKKHQTSDN